MAAMTPAVSDDAEIHADSNTSTPALDLQIAALQVGGISLSETLEIALKSLSSNKVRTLLTAPGIIIGVAAVVALMAIGQGSTASITATITANGANLLTVRSGASSSGGVRGQIGNSQTHTSGLREYSCYECTHAALVGSISIRQERPGAC